MNWINTILNTWADWLPYVLIAIVFYMQINLWDQIRELHHYSITGRHELEDRLEKLDEFILEVRTELEDKMFQQEGFLLDKHNDLKDRVIELERNK